MTEWTASAIGKRDDYFQKVRARLAATGADAAEVLEDLRLHIDREIEERKLTVVTSEDVQSILLRIGLPDIAMANGFEAAPAPTRAGRGTRFRSRFLAGSLVFFGILLPAIALGVEVVTGICRDAFFDPIPTWGHILLVGFVPLANLWIWLAAKRRRLTHPTLLGMANGASIAICLYYALLFLPVLPIAAFGFIAVIYFGIGLLALLPMAPLFGFVAGFFLRRRLRVALPPGTGARIPGVRRGFVLALVLAMAMSAPEYVTKIGLRMATSPSPEQSVRGIRLLRAMGNRDFLLRACYRSEFGPTDLVTWMFFSRGNTDHEAIRTVYYRVTGEPFERVPPPRIGLRGRGLSNMEFEFDPEQGGQVVAGRLKGLSLAESRLDATVDPDAATAYVEWTMVLRNDHTSQREARAQILLPEGGVVSRVTLWVNGEASEAAFGGRSAVRQAYERVVRQRRDPLLVTSSGQGRVLVQCFPVPPNGEMKIRLGITAPLCLETLDRGLFALPSLLERNFRIADEHRHAVWVESPRPLSITGSEMHAEEAAGGLHAVRGRLRDTELAGPEGMIRADRSREILYAWSADPLAGTSDLVLQSIDAVTAAPPSGIVFVIDGSAGMAPALPAVASVIGQCPEGTPFAVVLAADTAIDLAGLEKATPETLDRAAGQVRRIRCGGGMDNPAALLRAWELLATTERGAIVWIHGPQPRALGSVEELRQHFQRRPHGPALYDVQTGPGPNRIIEKLESVSAVRRAPQRGGVEADLTALLSGWSGQARTFSVRREKIPEVETPSDQTVHGSDHLVRLWALNRIDAILLSGNKELADEARDLAITYRLVTPVSGAVVLETVQQYKDAGLNPGDPQSVPVVPEPSTWLLVAIGLVPLTVRAARRRSRRKRGENRLATGARAES